MCEEPRTCDMPSSAFTLHTSFSPILSLYKGILLDQYGVIHNGSEALFRAVECIDEMRSQGKRMCILSNTSSPAKAALQRLPKYGLAEDTFNGIVTSGEEAAKYVREHHQNSKALWLTWRTSDKQQPAKFMDHCGKIEVASSVDDADFILLHGSECWRKCGAAGQVDEVDLNFMYSEDYSIVDELLKESISKSLPLICANPDLIVNLPGGIEANMPGKIASRYERMGGRVTQFGKPHPSHFLACLDELGVDPDACVHVGDSIEHDVAGANAANIDSVFVLGGIHARELGLEPTRPDAPGGISSDDEDKDSESQTAISKGELENRLSAFFEKKGIWPTHVVPSLALS